MMQAFVLEARGPWRNDSRNRGRGHGHWFSWFRLVISETLTSRYSLYLVDPHGLRAAQPLADLVDNGSWSLATHETVTFASL